MRKRTTKRSSTAELLELPPLNMAAARSPTLSPPESPVEQFEFNLNGFTTSTTKLTSSKKKSCKNSRVGASAFKMKQPTGIAAPSPKSVSTISGLKDQASIKLESIKYQLDSSRSEIVKDMEASQFRLQKRLKVSNILRHAKIWHIYTCMSACVFRFRLLFLIWFSNFSLMSLYLICLQFEFYDVVWFLIAEWLEQLVSNFLFHFSF